MIIDRIRDAMEYRQIGRAVLIPSTLPLPRTSLCKNNIGPSGARALAETLRTNTTLTVLK